MFAFSDRVSQQTVLRIEQQPWDSNNSAPALIKTKEIANKTEPIIITRTDETKISTNKASKLSIILQFEFLFFFNSRFIPRWIQQNLNFNRQKV